MRTPYLFPSPYNAQASYLSLQVKSNLGEREGNKALQTLSVAEMVFRPGLNTLSKSQKTGKIQYTE